MTVVDPRRRGGGERLHIEPPKDSITMAAESVIQTQLPLLYCLANINFQ